MKDRALEDTDIREALKDFILGSSVLSKRLYDYHLAQRADHREVLRLLDDTLNDREGLHESVKRISHDLHRQGNHTLRRMHMLRRTRREVDRLFNVINDRLYKTGGLPQVVPKYNETQKHQNKKQKWYDNESHATNRTHARDINSINTAVRKVNTFFDVLNKVAHL